MDVLVELQPSEPMKLIADYFLHYAHGSSMYHSAFLSATRENRYQNWNRVMGRTFQILAPEGCWYIIQESCQVPHSATSSRRIATRLTLCMKNCKDGQQSA